MPFAQRTEPQNSMNSLKELPKRAFDVFMAGAFRLPHHPLDPLAQATSNV